MFALWYHNLLLLSLSLVCTASKWPYDRYHATPAQNGEIVADPARPEFDERPTNEFGHWLRHAVDQDNSGALSGIFKNDTVPKDVTFDNLLKALDVPESPANDSFLLPPSLPSLPGKWATVANLFKHLNYPLDQNCLSDDFKWRFRTYDGSCNWLKAGESDQGQFGTAHSRDYDQHEYADGIGEPRQGPNPRAVSNAFFRRNETIYYEHTPFLLGLIEFIIHDVTYSLDSETDWIDIPVPDDETEFEPGTTFRVMRTEKLPGTGTSEKNPRENINRATTWLDVSSLYGSSQEVARKLRSYQSGKLLTQEVQANGTSKPASYLPFNSMDVPTRTRPGINETELFAGGDPRTNEDWIMLAVHTLMLREHNRLCDILAKQHPEYDDERLYQTVRLLMSAKFSLIGNAYQMAYWTDSMPWPRDDGFPLYREMYGKDHLEINPANTYPWPLVTKNGKPMTASAEMAVVYRFHEFIIPTFPIIDSQNNLVRNQSLFQTGFNAKGFIDTGLENILRGVESTHIPNFKSGVDESFRSAGKYRGRPFDIVTWSIVHEREQGLPTFNQYFREYNKQDPMVRVPIRKRFEDFTNNTVHLAALKSLYNKVDDVDLVVGCQLDEEMFPNTTVPKSALIISLFSLFGMGNSDRFSVGFAAMRCLLIDKPWDCHPSNALEELLWKPIAREGFPNFRFYDTFWMTELDLQAHGTNLLWRLVTENTEIKCLQKDPLFPFDPVKNPLMCTLPPQKVNIRDTLVSFLEIGLALLRQYKAQILASFSALAAFSSFFKKKPATGSPPVLSGWPFLGEALSYQKDPKKLLLQGFQKFGSSVSKIFGIRLASLTHYVLSDPKDLQMMLEDNPVEAKFSIMKFFEAIGMPVIVRKENFASNIHTDLIRAHLVDETTVALLGKTMQHAADHFLDENPLVPSDSMSATHPHLSDYLDRLITTVHARAMVGPDSPTIPELVPLFLEFNGTVDKTMGMAVTLPSFLHFIPNFLINRAYGKFRKIFVPIIRRRRSDPVAGTDGLLDFMPYVLKAIDDDNRASDLVTITVWLGLRNLQITVASTLLDILNVPDFPPKVRQTLRNGAVVENLHTFGTDPGKETPWSVLRSCMFESIRMCGPVTGPARIVTSAAPVPLASDPTSTLPPRQVATLSAYYSHRLPANYGKDAELYRSDRFLAHDPMVGSTAFISWGLAGPHLCPGRWFAQEAISIMVKALLVRYNFTPARFQDDDEKYTYHAGVVTRNEVPVTVTKWAS